MEYSVKMFEKSTQRPFCPKDDTYAVITPDQKRLGRIRDIDVTGMVFHYIDEYNRDAVVEENSDCTVDIFIKQQGFFLKELPIRKLTDAATANSLSFSQLPMRRITIEFGSLTTEQKYKLAYLASHYTANALSP